MRKQWIPGSLFPPAPTLEPGDEASSYGDAHVVLYSHIIRRPSLISAASLLGAALFLGYGYSLLAVLQYVMYENW